MFIALVGLAAALTSVAALRRNSGETRVALTAARTAIEGLRAQPYGTLLATYGSGVGFVPDADGDGVADLSPAPGQTLAGRLTVQNVPGLTSNQALRAIASVRWTGAWDPTGASWSRR